MGKSTWRRKPRGETWCSTEGWSVCNRPEFHLGGINILPLAWWCRKGSGRGGEGWGVISTGSYGLLSYHCTICNWMSCCSCSVQKYVKEQVLQVVAVICKRSIVEDSHIIQESLLKDVTQLMTSNNRGMVSVATLVMSICYILVFTKENLHTTLTGL